MGRTHRTRERAVVAELGRPETPEETAARRAESRRRRREHQTVPNLVLSLLATLGIVVFLIAVVVRPGGEDAVDPVDYRAVAAQAQPTAGEPLLAPALPGDWWSNRADLTGGSDDVTVWYVGFITPDDGFLALTQGLDANATWLAEAVRDAAPTGERVLGGVRWIEYDRRGDDDAGTHAYALSTVAGGSTVVLRGTASPAEFELLATAVAADLDGEEE